MLYNKRIYTPTFQLKNYVWLALFPRFVTILQMTWIDNWIREEMKEKQKTSLQSDMNIISQSILISNIWNLRVYNWRPQCFVNSSKDIRLLYSLYRETCDNTFWRDLVLLCSNSVGIGSSHHFRIPGNFLSVCQIKRADLDSYINSKSL